MRYEQAEYLVNLDAARIIDMLDERQASLKEKNPPPSGNGPQSDLKSATRIIRSKEGHAFRVVSWVATLADAVIGKKAKTRRNNIASHVRRLKNVTSTQ